MTLTVCLLTRNDERNLPRVLDSVAGLADEVLVADTGSTDCTMQVARERGAQVFSTPWDDDFAAARDAVLARATSDWVLWLHPDEELHLASQADVRRACTCADAFGTYAWVRDLHQEGRTDVYTETAQLRLFRRRPGLRSEGRLHPAFVPTLEEVAAAEGKRILPPALTIYRHGYQSPLTGPKLRWILRLLERELRDRPGRLPYLIDYGRTLLLAGDAQGHWVLAQAADQVLAAREAAAAPGAEVQRLLEYCLTVVPELSRSRLSREEARELALRWFPHSPPLLWLMAQQHFQAEDFHTAAGLLERLVALGRSGGYDRSEGFDRDLVGAAALVNLGICYMRLEEWDRAEACFVPLLDHPTLGAKAAQNRRVVQAARGRAGPVSCLSG
jgi:hypothetical protein